MSEGERDLSAANAAAMTVNERLFAAGLLEDFDDVVGQRNRDALRSTLRRAHFRDENIEAIVRRALKSR